MTEPRTDDQDHDHGQDPDYGYAPDAAVTTELPADGDHQFATGGIIHPGRPEVEATYVGDPVTVNPVGLDQNARETLLALGSLSADAAERAAADAAAAFGITGQASEETVGRVHPDRVPLELRFYNADGDDIGTVPVPDIAHGYTLHQAGGDDSLAEVVVDGPGIVTSLHKDETEVWPRSWQWLRLTGTDAGADELDALEVAAQALDAMPEEARGRCLDWLQSKYRPKLTVTAPAWGSGTVFASLHTDERGD